MRMTVTVFISLVWELMCFCIYLLFSLENAGGRAPIVSLFSLVNSWAFLALIFDLKFYAELSSPRLYNTNYRIWIYSFYRGLIFIK